MNKKLAGRAPVQHELRVCWLGQGLAPQKDCPAVTV